MSKITIIGGGNMGSILSVKFSQKHDVTLFLNAPYEKVEEYQKDMVVFNEDHQTGKQNRSDRWDRHRMDEWHAVLPARTARVECLYRSACAEMAGPFYPLFCPRTQRLFSDQILGARQRIQLHEQMR